MYHCSNQRQLVVLHFEEFLGIVDTELMIMFCVLCSCPVEVSIIQVTYLKLGGEHNDLYVLLLSFI